MNVLSIEHRCGPGRQGSPGGHQVVKSGISECMWQCAAQQVGGHVQERGAGIPGGRLHRVHLQPVTLGGTEEAVGALTQTLGNLRACPGARAGTHQQIVRHPARALHESFHGRVGVGQTGRVFIGEHQRAHVQTHAALAQHAHQLAGRGMQQDHVHLRSRIGQGAHQRGTAALRIHMAQWQAAGGHVVHVVGQLFDAFGQVETGQLGRRAGALTRIDDQGLEAEAGEGGTQALQHHAAEHDLRVGNDGNETNHTAGEHLAQAMGLVDGPAGAAGR